MRALVSITVWLALAKALIAADPVTFRGHVDRLADGDTLTLRVGEGSATERVVIRLKGIDCPESRQAFGSAAKKFASRWLGQDEITAVASEKDRYGRWLAIVTSDVECESLNAALLRAGLAWHFKRYDDDPQFAALEAEAKAAKRGLWSAKRPQSPWLYRQRRKERRQ